MSKGHDDSGRRPPSIGQQATLYDAVAGRVGYEGFLSEQQPSKYRDTASSSLAAVPPDEILFRRKGAPVRFAEDYIYEADRHLKPHQRLPDSDLLKAVHAYAADYYDKALTLSSVNVGSMDETALLAVGILLEEAAVEALGKTGDLAFVEPSGDNDDGSAMPMYWHNGQPRRSVMAHSRPVRGKRREETGRSAAHLDLTLRGRVRTD